MQTWRIKLKPITPFCTPIEADTLFGHLCWAVKYHGWNGRKDDESLDKFLKLFVDEPPVLISDGFPGDKLPFPLLSPELMKSIEKKNRDSWSQYGKKFKNLEYLNRDIWQRLVLAENPESVLNEIYLKHISESDMDKDIDFKETTTLKNSISRSTMSTYQEGGGLFSLKETFYRDEDDVFISVYLRCDESYADNMKLLLCEIGKTGFGKKKTIGKGAFEILGHYEPMPDLTYSSGVFISLSPFVDNNKSLDLDQSRYKLRVKIGKVGENLSVPGTPFVKKPVAFFQPGSVFTPANDETLIGTMINDILPNAEGMLKKVIQYAWAFPVGVKYL